MATLKPWATRVGLVTALATVLIGVSCSSTPTTPTPPPPPPVANAPTLTCGEGIARATTSAAGMAISYDNPTVKDGEGAVKITCSPESGSTFPIGTTEVSCTGTDTLN